MALAQGIRKHGFRRWHERQLLIGHGWLVVTLIAAVAAFATLESLIQSNQLTDRLANLAAFAILGGVTAISLQRFLAHLIRAQRASQQARCTHCETWGRLEALTEDPHGKWLRVRCRQCAHEWPMDEP
jgi:hypothetical protein